MSENAYIEEQRILKQCYLREEILEAGYDPYSFKLHMETLKEDGLSLIALFFLISFLNNTHFFLKKGSNIDNWTLADLQKAVIAFKKQPQFERIPQEEVLIQEKRPDNPQTHIESLSEIEGVNIEPNEEQKTQFQRPIKEVLTKEGDTLALDVPIRKQKSCFEGPLPSQISIIRTEEEKGGFFGIGRTHVVYIVSSEPCEWEVKRRFKDFTWLRETLAKLYPGFLVRE